MERRPGVWGLGLDGRGYLYINDILIGPAEEACLTALPVDPHPGNEPGFVELSVKHWSTSTGSAERNGPVDH